MEVAFSDAQLDRLETDPGFAAGHPPGVVKAFRKRMQLIRGAQDERAFHAMRSLNFEKLKGARSHQHSMRLNDQWRLILELRGSGAGKLVQVVCIEDYH